MPSRVRSDPARWLPGGGVPGNVERPAPPCGGRAGGRAELRRHLRPRADLERRTAGTAPAGELLDACTGGSGHRHQLEVFRVHRVLHPRGLLAEVHDVDHVRPLVGRRDQRGLNREEGALGHGGRDQLVALLAQRHGGGALGAELLMLGVAPLRGHLDELALGPRSEVPEGAVGD